MLIAHRGGVIAPNAPENSLEAIRLAAVHGYDMVELDVREASGGEAVSLSGQFWFGWAAELPDEAVCALQQNGALVVVSINTFHYPAHAQQSLARQDIRRLLAAGVGGFQIDSVYGDCFGVGLSLALTAFSATGSTNAGAAQAPAFDKGGEDGFSIAPSCPLC